MTYTAPRKDMRFILRHLTGVEDAVPGDVIDAVLEEAGKLAENVWAPLNAPGDRQGSRLMPDGTVKTPDGFHEAYRAFAEGGWNGLTCAEEHGGQGLPAALGMAVGEMWQGANLALSLCPLLSQAAIEAVEKHGTPEQKETYLKKMVSGAWTGAMHLTEPQAGTDLAAIRTVARKNGDHYLMKGQKIFITWGDHDFTPNIIHLVLSRVDGLPEGNDGLGLFIVPKFLVNPDGSLGRRNDVKAVSLEHKLGIHASPTCVMSCGEEGGAVAYLVGEEGKGLRNMFTMMNNARIGVGLQGVGVAEAACQRALAYARDRVQGSAMGDKSGKRVAIVNHPDVRRMLLTMKAHTQAARALTYYAGGMIDRSSAGDAFAAARVDFLTPLVKAWATDMAVETASLGVQVHGGMGFIEETGAAQFYRDARILPIYEGTNGIQSNDFLYRKVLRDGGAHARGFMDEMQPLAAAVPKLGRALSALRETTDWVVKHAPGNAGAVAAGAQPFQRQFSLLAGGCMMARLAAAAENDTAADPAFRAALSSTARFFAGSLLPAVHGLSAAVMGGGAAAVEAHL